MKLLLRLVKGSPGKPLHPPLIDARIGAYTVGIAALIAGKAGLQTPQMADTNALNPLWLPADEAASRRTTHAENT